MRTETAVRERLARMERDLKYVRVTSRKAVDRPPRSHHLWDADPQLFASQITAIESAIEELHSMLKEED